MQLTHMVLTLQGTPYDGEAERWFREMCEEAGAVPAVKRKEEGGNKDGESQTLLLQRLRT
jgi:hypothetical protein